MKINKDLYMRISNLTNTDYEGIVLSEDVFYVESETIEAMFQDLFCTIDDLEEDLESEIQDKRDNYKPISKYEEIGMSERDFI